MNISIKPIQKDKSLSNLAYEELVKRITRLELPPGSVLAERNLVEELGIGRTPVREALQRLAIEGL
ncbi:MAG: GntR family transcriptional regulator, partial [Gammaproteobacteria bacterium]|nr:GntR family transcriptional regulator [Gammaproteobacteria bacterium]